MNWSKTTVLIFTNNHNTWVHNYFIDFFRGDIFIWRTIYWWKSRILISSLTLEYFIFIVFCTWLFQTEAFVVLKSWKLLNNIYKKVNGKKVKLNWKFSIFTKTVREKVFLEYKIFVEVFVSTIFHKNEEIVSNITLLISILKLLNF